MQDPHRCADCGTELPPDQSTEDLCPGCLMRLANDRSEFGRAEPLGPGEMPTLLATKVSSEHVLGDRYQMRALLGRGGMGEVWHAFDLKLRVEVALKSLRRELVDNELALELLRREVRSAREVVSPNVCRVFDLVTAQDQELVSMEYVDGITLLEVLRERGPLELREAGEIAAQFLAGLEAIHQADLVHRDVKPENIMITRSGRVVVMDFGIAKGLTDRPAGTVSGTPAYMAPEQARGEAVDARADVYAAGVMLTEMIHPEDLAEPRARTDFWAALRTPSPKVPKGPWQQVLAKALAWNPDDRYPTAHALSRALEEVTLRADGIEDRCPYPGLATFTKNDAEFFFGRELEVESIWKKLDRPRLLAVIGPSGAGKSSFLHAGLLAKAPEGWRSILCTPGKRPFTSLAQALGPELAGDADAVRELPRFDEPDTAVSLARRWSTRHERSLVVIDQFEELFTLNPVDIQARYAELLARFALEANIHVIVSMRDDFLFHCHEQEALAPVFSEVTPLGPPTGGALRRALVQPALVCGYRFEDDALVDDMLDEITGERGALPLLAFAAARLWDKRNRDEGLLTREAYVAIGGVAGALAQHAEATLQRIGSSQTPIVREVFRNLVTAKGTRAATDREELLTVFDHGSTASPRNTDAEPTDRASAESVLDALTDARLLTSFDVAGDDRAKGRVEIIHESLLTAWPRLVRWQNQEAENAQLRDQLRQSAQLWEERGRPADLLWTGTSFKEFELWRERYAGGLTDTEESYAAAMQAHAQRRQRRHRIATGATIAVLLGVVVVISALWVQSHRSERQAIAQAQRAEASKLFAMGQLEQEEHPTAALAFALKSLELADSFEVRQFVVDTLWRGPTAFVLGTNEGTSSGAVRLSPDGAWLLQESTSGRPRLWASDGSEPRWLEGHEVGQVHGGFSVDSRWLSTFGRKSARLWSLPQVEEVRQFERNAEPFFSRIYDNYFLEWIRLKDRGDGLVRRIARGWPLSGGAPETLGLFQFSQGSAQRPAWLAADPVGKRLLIATGGDLYELPLRGSEVASPRRILQSPDPIDWFEVEKGTGGLVAHHGSGSVRFWSPSNSGEGFEADRTLFSLEKRPISSIDFSRHRTWQAVPTGWDQTIQLWDLSAPHDTKPMSLRRGVVNRFVNTVFDPSGRWMFASDSYAVSIWPLTRDYSYIVAKSDEEFRTLAFHPQGDWLAAVSSSNASGGGVWLLPLTTSGEAAREVFRGSCGFVGLDVSPSGDFIAAGSLCGEVLLVSPTSGAPVKKLAQLRGAILGLAFDAEGRRLAVGGNVGDAVVRVWDLATEEVQVLDPGRPTPVVTVSFTPDGKLLSSNLAGGVHLWDVDAGTSELLLDGNASLARLNDDGRFAAGIHNTNPQAPGGKAFVYDLEQRNLSELETHGDDVFRPSWDPTAELVLTPSRDGTIRVGPRSGEEPHLLLGHEAAVWDVAVDPGRRWVASASADGTVRLWPMPSGEPFHTLPYQELLERMRPLTNYRIVEDETEPSGYRLQYGPFAGWNREPPTW